MRKALPLSCLLLLAALTQLRAQLPNSQDEDNTVNYGIKAGAIYSKISGLETTILSEPYFLNYSLTAKGQKGWTGGFFINYRPMSILGLETELMYAMQGSDLLFNNYEKDFNYKIAFNYQFINIPLHVKLYPMAGTRGEGHRKAGFWLGGGPMIGFNVASTNIVYTSGGPGRLAAFGSDLETQQQLRNVLKGKNNFGFDAGLGYEGLFHGMTLDFKAFFGTNDIVQTQANSYNFIETKNTNTTYRFTIGWDFSVFNHD